MGQTRLLFLVGKHLGVEQPGLQGCMFKKKLSELSRPTNSLVNTWCPLSF